MNKRQQKKRLKKALDVLNEIEVFDSDVDGDGVIYVLVDNNKVNQKKLDQFCGLMQINKRIFIKDCTDDVDEEYIDLVSIWFHCPEPKGYAIYYGYKQGFVLCRHDERNE